MSQACKWLHNQLESLSAVRYPFNVNQLPQNGIYFFYENGERSNHGDGDRPRIVRIGTHKDGNFRTRISEHFLLTEKKMQFSEINSKPSDRSIFRKNIGRAILCKESDHDYLKIWEVDFTISKNRNDKRMLRNIEREREIESRITKLLRDNFQFRFIHSKVRVNGWAKVELRVNSLEQ